MIHIIIIQTGHGISMVYTIRSDIPIQLTHITTNIVVYVKFELRDDGS